MDERERKIIIGIVLGATGCGCLIWFAIVAAILYPVFVRAREKARLVDCLSNQKQIAMAVMQYAVDYHDTFPPASQWTDAIKPYLRNDALLKCPSARHLECGYAFYQPLGSRKIASVSQPAFTPMLFDSRNGKSNFADKGQSLAFRHLNGAALSFADGHVKWFSASRAKQVFKQPSKP